jgi:hypothetical protein
MYVYSSTHFFSELLADLHLLGEQFDDISPKKRVSDSFEPFRIELRP